MIVFDAQIIGEWVCQKSGGRWFPGNPSIGIVKNGKLVAGVTYDGYTGSSIAMHWRFDSPHATSREFYRIMFDYPFNQLNVKRITGIVKKSNHRSISLGEKLGFKFEAALRDYFPEDDALVYAMYKDDCRILRKEKNVPIEATT